MKLPSKFIKITAVFLVAAAGLGWYYYLHHNEETTDDAAIDGRVVSVSPKIQGYVKAVYMEDNALVKAGDILLEIDPTDYLIRRDRAKAALAAAKAAVQAAENQLSATEVSAPSNVEAAAAQVAAARANWEKAYADLMRAKELYAAGAYAKQQLDQCIATEKADRSALEKLQADLRAAKTAPNIVAKASDTKDQLTAQMQQAEADLAQAETDLANTKIIAPIDGRITKRSVETGNYVQAGQQLGSLVGTEFWVTANFKETQLKNMQIGQPVDISIDAFPGRQFRGHIESFQAGTGAYFSLFPAENATGNFVKTVQRIPVKITFDAAPDPSLPLGPGMSVIPTVHTNAVTAP